MYLCTTAKNILPNVSVPSRSRPTHTGILSWWMMDLRMALHKSATGFVRRGGDGRIKTVHQENMGLIGARKTGLANATGEFITFVDADDLVEPEMLQTLLDTQVKYSADIVYCGFKRLSRNGWIKRGHRKSDQGVIIRSGRDEAVCMASSYSSVTMWGKLYRRSIFEKAQDLLDTIPYIFYGEDSMINAAVFSKADTVVEIPDELYDYRVGGGSSGSTEKTMHELAELYRWRKNFLLNANADNNYHQPNLDQVLNVAAYYAHFSKKLLSREKICMALADVIADMESISPNYQHKNAYDLNIPMTDEEFKNIYHEQPTVVIKQLLLRFF